MEQDQPFIVGRDFNIILDIVLGLPRCKNL